MKYRKGSIVEVVDHNPDGTKTTRKVKVVSAKTKRHKSGVEWTMLHIKDIEPVKDGECSGWDCARGTTCPKCDAPAPSQQGDR